MPDQFLTAYPPTAATPMPAAQLARLEAAGAPLVLMQLWREHGLGLYANGLLQLIDPEQFRPALAEWLAADKPGYTPFALGAFGQLYYHRQLTPTDEDVCSLDPHYREISSCTWSLESFFEDYLPDPEVREYQLRELLFGQALARHGALPPGYIYCFVPALALGGTEDAASTSVGEARAHLSLLFQLG